MFKYVGREVADDEELKEFARREWSDPHFKALMAKLRAEDPARDSEDVLREA